MEMALTRRIISTLVERRNKVLNGGINCIPLPFVRFRQDWPGAEQERLYCVSGGTKAAKSQLTLFLFVINPLMYCFYHPDKGIKMKIFFFPLEESKEAVTLKVMAFVISHITEGKLKISPTDLKSTDERKPLPQEVLDIMETDKFKQIMSLYESMVRFSDEQNRIGIYKVLHDYASTHGTFHHKLVTAKEVDELGIIHETERKIFDYYTPNDPDEYVFAIVDHLSLLTPIKGEDLRATISMFAEDCVKLRNRCKMSIVGVQQQNIESTGLEAFKLNKIRPTVAGLADCKDFGKACNMMLGITNPHYFEVSEYLGYKIANAFKGNIRFMEICINRDGQSNGICPLLFYGEVNSFRELPPPSDSSAIKRILEQLIAVRELNRVPQATISLFAWAKKLIN